MTPLYRPIRCRGFLTARWQRRRPVFDATLLTCPYHLSANTLMTPTRVSVSRGISLARNHTMSPDLTRSGSSCVTAFPPKKQVPCFQNTVQTIGQLSSHCIPEWVKEQIEEYLQVQQRLSVNMSSPLSQILRIVK